MLRVMELENGDRMSPYDWSWLAFLFNIQLYGGRSRSPFIKIILEDTGRFKDMRSVPT
jgi:hypothetical protein